MESLFVFDANGSAVIEKQWFTQHNRKLVTTTFLTNKQKPIIHLNSKYSLIPLHRHCLHFVALTSIDVSPLTTIEFLNSLVDLLVSYFGDLSETVLRKWFDTVFQLLEETYDNGKPYTAEPCILKDIIQPPSLMNSVLGAVSIGTTFGTDTPSLALSGVSWRLRGVKYTSNEIFFDFNENIDLLFDNVTNSIISADSRGEIVVKSKLSGMPHLVLQFLNSNHQMLSELYTCFHPCVDVPRFTKEKSLSFIPPDGSFKLMEYTKSITLSDLPVIIRPNVSLQKNQGKIGITVVIKTGQNVIENLAIVFQFPSWVASVMLNPTMGRIHFDQSTKFVRWNVGKLSNEPGSLSPALSGIFSFEPRKRVLPSITFQVDFNISGYTVCALKAENLLIHNEPYKPYKGFRSSSKAGRYQIRL